MLGTYTKSLSDAWELFYEARGSENGFSER